MKCDYVILGGGVGGLVAAKRLLELGIAPLVIEATGYPCHKVCGEFLSPPCLPILYRFGINPKPIAKVHLHAKNRQMELILPIEGGSLSHFTLDLQLADQIAREGAALLTHTKVVDLIPPSHERESHLLTLSSGEKIWARHLLIGTGRLPSTPGGQPPRYPQPMQPRYLGIKSHFSGLKLGSCLHLFALKGAYLGISPIENGLSNIACLARLECARAAASTEEFMQGLIASHPYLSRLLVEGEQTFAWMEASVPEFGHRMDPQWLQTYRIGDAAATIPPASGSGLSLAIVSGYLAAEYAARGDALAFAKMWKRRCRQQIFAAKGLHRLMLNPNLGSSAIALCSAFPRFGEMFFQLTR